MALGYLTWLWISPSHRNTGKLLPFTLSLSHTQTYLALKCLPLLLLFILCHFFPHLRSICLLIMASSNVSIGSVITPNHLLC